MRRKTFTTKIFSICSLNYNIVIQAGSTATYCLQWLYMGSNFPIYSKSKTSFNKVLFIQYKASLNGCFMDGFMALNIINFANMTMREKDEVL